jgi:alkaline phosphatase D
MCSAVSLIRSLKAAAQNDFVRWYNSNRGYVSCDLTPQTWTSHFRTTPFVDKPGSPFLTKGSFVIEQGKPGAKQA